MFKQESTKIATGLQLRFQTNDIKTKSSQFLESFFKFKIWQQLIFPGGYPPSIVSASSLYDRVRDGNGWSPTAWPPENLMSCSIFSLHAESCTDNIIKPLYFLNIQCYQEKPSSD